MRADIPCGSLGGRAPRGRDDNREIPYTLGRGVGAGPVSKPEDAAEDQSRKFLAALNETRHGIGHAFHESRWASRPRARCPALARLAEPKDSCVPAPIQALDRRNVASGVGSGCRSQ